jgi:hypothetical protein
MKRGRPNTIQILMPESARAKKPSQVTQDYVEKKAHWPITRISRGVVSSKMKTPMTK